MTLSRKSASTSIRLSHDGRCHLDALVQETGKKQVEILDLALEKLHEAFFWKQVDAGFIAHAAELEAGYALFDGAIGDGLAGSWEPPA